MKKWSICHKIYGRARITKFLIILNGLKISITFTLQPSASVCAYQILQAFSFKSVWTLLEAFITYVRPE